MQLTYTTHKTKELYDTAAKFTIRGWGLSGVISDEKIGLIVFSTTVSAARAAVGNLFRGVCPEGILCIGLDNPDLKRLDTATFQGHILFTEDLRYVNVGEYEKVAKALRALYDNAKSGIHRPAEYHAIFPCRRVEEYVLTAMFEEWKNETTTRYGFHFHNEIAHVSRREFKQTHAMHHNNNLLLDRDAAAEKNAGMSMAGPIELCLDSCMPVIAGYADVKDNSSHPVYLGKEFRCVHPYKLWVFMTELSAHLTANQRVICVEDSVAWLCFMELLQSTPSYNSVEWGGGCAASGGPVNPSRPKYTIEALAKVSISD